MNTAALTKRLKELSIQSDEIFDTVLSDLKEDQYATKIDIYKSMLVTKDSLIDNLLSIIDDSFNKKLSEPFPVPAGVLESLDSYTSKLKR